MHASPARPLVSVLVRTLGCPELATALQSVARQSHRPVEVVLVEAGAERLAAVPNVGIPLHRVWRGEPLDRPRAANAGLDAARGEWLVFLDEDDTFEATHVADLLAALQAAPGSRAAYSQARLVGAGAERVFVGPFNRLALLRSNFLAIHAVLFARSLVAEGCRFDETLATFEDWDFWLQCARRTGFAFTGKPTALHRASEGASGARARTNLDAAAVKSQRDRLMVKWHSFQQDLVRRHRYAMERADRAGRSGRRDEAAQWLDRARALVEGTPPRAANEA